ncbi:MAG TPA: hypothetical protein PLS71_15005 [Leptospiraceae bacterium]|nr:hypothetical protein [Leptospiraceae bacterium]HNB99553.1 hypothetical protein [Leptospiraceae bacterium]HNE09737.1 hypothetical protein [Leptospiraceae bacterium]HNH00575.1 hypothetical protein [Leptospiraceae bacterium]HNH56771.1 hypothetical protein [Leptospiraceae bacterium]
MIIATSIFSQNSEKWSDYQGVMDWETANKKCSSINMRLPSIEELKVAMKEGSGKQWKKDGLSYWSNAPSGGYGGAYSITIEAAGYRISNQKDGYLNVRCIDGLSIMNKIVKEKISMQWSELQGSGNWEYANIKCTNIKMKLPSIDELKYSIKDDVIKSWEKDGLYYWSSEPFHYIDIKNGSIKENMTVDDKFNVRCTHGLPISKKWIGGYQGDMSWQEATERCANLGLRLPTINELKAAYLSKTMKSWDYNYITRHFWSSTPSPNSSHYTFSNGDKTDLSPSDASVYCIQ